VNIKLLKFYFQIKIQLSAQLDDVKRMADDEAKERLSLLGR